MWVGFNAYGYYVIYITCTHDMFLFDLVYIYSFTTALGVIDKWYKKEGDLIKRDEVICDIRTDVGAFLLETVW